MRSFYILLSLIAGLSSLGQEDKFKKLIPSEPTGWVSDFEKDFTESELTVLDSIIQLHEKQTGNEIAIVTLKLDSLDIGSTEEYEQLSLGLFNQWRIGKPGKKNGVLILFSKSLRKVRIEVGYGLETKLTDPEARVIIDSVMIPEFKRSGYFEGILKGLAEIIKHIR